MAVQLNISYETLVELVEQLPPDKKHDLLLRLMDKKLSADEKKALYHASILSVPVNEPPSIRREDWYQ